MFSLFLQISISEITKQNLPPHQAKNPFDNKGVASGKTNEDDELSSNHYAEVQVNKYWNISNIEKPTMYVFNSVL